MSLRILAIEDNPGDLKIIHVLLAESRHEFEIINASNLKQAQILLRNEKIDAILLDLGLPDSNDLATFRKVMKIAVGVPIIILSGSVDEELAMTAVQEGAQDYLVKGSINSELLTHAIIYAIVRNNSDNTIEEFSELIENFNEAVICKTLNGTIISWNKAATRLYGYEKDEIIGKSISIIIPPEAESDLDYIMSRAIKGESILEYETIRRKKNGEKINVSLTVSPIREKSGKIIAFSAMARDITAKKIHEQQLSIQYRVALALTESSNLNSAAKAILKTICEILNWQMGEIWAIDRSADVLKYVASYFAKDELKKLEDEFSEISYPEGEGLPGHIWQTREIYWIKDLEKETRSNRKQKLLEHDFNSGFGFPILFKEEVLGVILFFGAEIQNSNISFLKIFTEIGKQLGIFIKRKRMEGDLLYLAQHDILTGLGNRIVIEDSLNFAIVHAKQRRKLVGVIYIDLDYFKKINDKLGHVIGDLVLQNISERLRECVRQTDIIARFGGDEFVIILPNLESKANAAAIAVKLLDKIKQPLLLKGKDLKITASIGISLYPDDGSDVQTLIKSADLAMYHAKICGRDNYQFALPQMTIMTQKKVFFENELKKALEKNEFMLFYQPKIAIKSGKIVGVEALIRWARGGDRILAPHDFLNLAEESNLMIPIGEWVLRTACTQVKEWHDKVDAELTMSVNLSTQQFDPQLIQILKTTLDETQLKPKFLELEITENTLMYQNEKNISLINSIRNVGVQLSIDDFGVGYSSFAQLKNYNINSIKIDRSFMTGFPVDPNSKAIVSAIVVMAHSLNLKVVAEGVETEQQLDSLKQLNCDQYQGYYFSGPILAEKISHLIRNQGN